MNRRMFFKTLGAAAVGAALPGAAKAAGAECGGEELATLLDLSKCVGCGECVLACREANADRYPEPKKPFPKMYPERAKVSDWSDRRDVDDRLTPYNWLFIQEVQVDYKGESHTITVPRRCMHCQNPPCVTMCPFGSAGRRGDGTVAVNPNTCFGGAKCKKVCPWDVPQRQTGVGLYLDVLPSYAGNGVMYKCDRCGDRLEKGETPACIEACPFEVQTIGPRSEILAKAHALAEETGGFIYGETENGGTNTIYVSPVPFDVLDAALEKGPGRPGLERVENAMSDAEILSGAALLAPVAGVAVGALKLSGILSKQQKAEGGDV